MNITKEYIQQSRKQISEQFDNARLKIIELEAALKKIKDDANACDGALQVLSTIEKRLEEEEPKLNNDKPDAKPLN